MIRLQFLALFLAVMPTAFAQAQTPPATSDALDCLVQPRATVEVASPVEGVIASIEVDRGDAVQKNQIVARLEASVERAAVEAARGRTEMKAAIERGQVRAAFAQRNLDNSAELKRRNAISDRTFDEAETEKRLAEVEIEEAREANRLADLDLRRATAILERRTLRSPVNGVVVRRIRSPGEYADPPQILEIAEVDPLHVEVFAPLSRLGTIELGDRAHVTREGPDKTPLDAHVTVVDRVIDAPSGTFGVRLELPNPGNKIPAGLRCQVRFLDEKTEEDVSHQARH